MANKPTLADQNLSMHERLILEVMDDHPEVRRHGFWDAMKSLPAADYTLSLLMPGHWWKKSIAFLPDAYAVCDKNREVTIFEMVCSHEISDEKFERIVELAFALEEDYWSLGLVRVDCFERRPFLPINCWIERQAAKIHGKPIPPWLSLHGLSERLNPDPA